MTILRFSFAVISALPLFAGPVLAGPSPKSFPRITLAKDARACGQALAVAKRAFDSTATKVGDAAPVILNDKKPDFGILLAPDIHNPDGDEMIVDASAIQQENGGAFKSVLLQRTPADGLRFVVTQQKMNWQGDFFGLYLVDATLDAAKTADLLASEKKTGARMAFRDIFKDSWRGPWLIRDPQTEGVVATDTQHPAEFLADWIVYRNAKGTLERACRIAFRPPARRASELLPTGALRELATLLDDILGVPAQDEGTLQPTSRIRVAAMQAWANAALRPWSLEKPYNSQQEIAEGLKEWIKRSPVYRARYRRLQELLPKAERDLATYYRKTLQKPRLEAASLAKQALGRAVGTHFVFGKKAE